MGSLAQFIDSVGSVGVNAFMAGARSSPQVVPTCTNAAIISIRENILDRRLSRDGVMMHEKNLWTQATSATAATKSKRSRFAEGRAVGRASNVPGLEVDGGLEVETNWQQVLERPVALHHGSWLDQVPSAVDSLCPLHVDRLRRPLTSTTPRRPRAAFDSELFVHTMERLEESRSW